MRAPPCQLEARCCGGVPASARPGLGACFAAVLLVSRHALPGCAPHAIPAPGPTVLQVWRAMNAAVAAVREEEAQLGLPPHIATVQGTRNWGRSLAYYVSNPITAGGGANIVYETHPCECTGAGRNGVCTCVSTTGGKLQQRRRREECRRSIAAVGWQAGPAVSSGQDRGLHLSPTSHALLPRGCAVNGVGEFDALFVNPSKTLPVVLGELGPMNGSMTTADAEAAMRRASNLSLPWTAWSLHMRCPPNILQDLSGGGCGVAMPLRLTDWGRLVLKYING